MVDNACRIFVSNYLSGGETEVVEVTSELIRVKQQY